jgi:hypothetical protein
MRGNAAERSVEERAQILADESTGAPAARRREDALRRTGDRGANARGLFPTTDVNHRGELGGHCGLARQQGAERVQVPPQGDVRNAEVAGELARGHAARRCRHHPQRDQQCADAWLSLGRERRAHEDCEAVLACARDDSVHTRARRATRARHAIREADRDDGEARRLLRRERSAAESKDRVDEGLHSGSRGMRWARANETERRGLTSSERLLCFTADRPHPRTIRIVPGWNESKSRDPTFGRSAMRASASVQLDAQQGRRRRRKTDQRVLTLRQVIARSCRDRSRSSVSTL